MKCLMTQSLKHEKEKETQETKFQRKFIKMQKDENLILATLLWKKEKFEPSLVVVVVVDVVDVVVVDSQ